MKVIVIVVVLALLAGGAYLFLSKNTALFGGNSGPKFTLVKETGTISYKQKESDQYQELLNEEVDLPNGSFIKTADESYARIFLPDNSLVSVDVSTEIQINFAENKTDIQQLIGKTWNRVQTLTQGGEYKIETPNTVAAVRGTIFGVGVDDADHSRAFSIEHTINVGKYDDDSSNILEDEDITDGKLANVNSDNGQLDIITGDLTNDILNSYWYKRNKIVDEEWKKIKDLEGVDLAKLLKENLLKRADYNELKLGLPEVETDLSTIQQRLSNAYALSQITTNTCKEHTVEQIQLAIDEVKLYKNYVLNYQGILNLLDKLKVVCADGRMSAEEATELQSLVNAANQQ